MPRFRRFFLIGANQVLTLIVGVVGIKLLSQLVSPNVNGLYALFGSLTYVGFLLVYADLLNQTSRSWQQIHAQNQQQQFLRYIWIIFGKKALTLTVFLSASVVVIWLLRRESAWILTLPFLILANLGLVLTEICLMILNASERHHAILWFRFAAFGSRIGLPLLFAAWISPTFLCLAIGFGLHSIVVAINSWRLCGWGTPVQPKLMEAWTLELTNYGRPFLWLGVGGWLLSSIDRWIVLKTFGETQAGFFAFSTNITTIMVSMAIAFLMQHAFPRVFRDSDLARSIEDWRKIAAYCDRLTLYFFSLVVPALLALSWKGHWLVPWLIDQQYAPAISMLLPAGLSMVAMQVNQFWFLIMQGQRKTWSMVRVMSVVAGLKTIGSIFWAAVSWDAFCWWLIASPFLFAAIGRMMIYGIGIVEPEGQQANSD